MKIIKTFREDIPEARFIGKKYTEADRTNGSFGRFWGEWFQKGWFQPLEALSPQKADTAFDGSYYGWMRGYSAFEYWIGMLFPANTPVPEGYDFIDMPASSYGICWLYGNENTGELYGMDAHNRSEGAIVKEGMKLKQGDVFAFERYNCPRFTTPDEHGNVILDYGIQIAE